MDAFKVFHQRGQVTFEITQRNMKISTICPPYIYLFISNSIYSISPATVTPIEFTIDSAEIIRNINLLDSNIILLNDSFRIANLIDTDFSCLISKGDSLFDPTKYHDFDVLNYSFIDIPFLNPIESCYVLFENFSTKFFMKKEVLKLLINRNVRYQNSNCLIVKKIGVGFEETMEIEVDYLQSGFLDFCCSNSWLGVVEAFYEIIDTVLFGFNDSIMSVKFLLKAYQDIFIEIQINEKELNIPEI